MIVCLHEEHSVLHEEHSVLHEEHSVAIAHGYAKVTDRPMAAAVHANVGLMHATMAVYNAFTDRVPLLILGATGPLDKFISGQIRLKKDLLGALQKAVKEVKAGNAVVVDVFVPPRDY
jgi:thiamine pyrophosphate-dependent acetolactate synthase large subunit-like protein